MSDKITANLLLHNAGELLTIAPASAGPQCGPDLSQLGIIEAGAVAVRDGHVVWIGTDPDTQIELLAGGQEIDAAGRVVSPGLVDPHTHLVFAATREQEFEMRALGKTYAQIAAAGGGIVSSVGSLRQADRQDLIDGAMARLDTMLAHGTTTVEAKSGYGLNLDDEIKTLEVVREVNRQHVVDIVPTVLAAHEFPPEYRHDRDGYVKLVTDEILPAVVEQNLAEFSDVFFEKGVFDREQTIAVQKKAKALGLQLKFHADQLTDHGGAILAAQMGAVSADHLEFISRRGVEQMAERGVIAVLLPGAGYFLDMAQRPPVRPMIEAGVPIALATDLNPGSSMTESMQLMMNMACVLYKMTPAETFVAATLNAAHAIKCGDTLGSLAVGKQADIVVWDADHYRQIPYHFGVNLAKQVIKKGVIVP